MKKRLLALALALVMLFPQMSALASDMTEEAKLMTSQVQSDDKFEFDSSTGTIKKYLGTDTDIEIPSKIGGVYVKEIGKMAFAKKKLTSVILPEGLEKIGDGAFSGNALTSISLPKSLKEFGRTAFAANAKLKEVNLNEGLEIIGQQAFMKDTSLNSELVIPSTVKYIMTSALNASSVTGIFIKGDEKSSPITIKSGINGEKLNYIKTESPFKDIKVNFNSMGLAEGDKKLDLGKVEVKAKTKDELLNWLSENIEVDYIATYANNNDTSGFNDKEVVLEKTWNIDKFSLDDEFEVTAAIDKSKLKEFEQIDGYKEPCVTCSKTNIVITLKVKLSSKADDTKFTSQDFTYGTIMYKGKMQEEVEKFAITGLTKEGKEKLSQNPNLEIPKEVTTSGQVKQVEAIAKAAFKNLKIDSLVFPKVDEKIQFVIMDSAFENSEVKEVSFEEGLYSIESVAFKDNKLTKVSLPSTVWKVGSEAFMNNQISELKISDEVILIQLDNYSFANNKLSLVKLPYSIFKIRDFVFKDNPGYEKTGLVRLETRNPDHLSSTTYIVAKNDHHEIVLLTKAKREKLWKEIISTKEIDRQDYKKTDLEEFDRVLEEAKSVFKNQESSQAQIDKALSDLIDAKAKLRASAPSRTLLRDAIRRAEEMVEEMFTPDSYKLMKDALEEAKKVLLNFDATAKEIEDAKNKLNLAIQNLVISENAIYKKEDFTYSGNAITGFSEKGKSKFKFNKNLVLPDQSPEGKEIEIIGKGAFSLEKDPGVSLGTDTVSSKNGLNSLSLPKNLKRIEQDAFRLNNIKTVDFPKTLEYIGISAFNGNKLEKVILPESVKDVEGGAFSLNQITELKLSPNMTEIKDGSFARNIKLKNLEIPEGIKYIRGSAFQGAPLNKLSIATTVVEIEKRAFMGHQLEELTIPGNVKVIGPQAFAHNIKWKRLKKLNLAEGIEKIGDTAFRYSLLLESKLPKSLKEIADNAFKNAETTDKKPVVVKLYTENSEHLKFNNKKSLENQEVILLKGDDKPKPQPKPEPGKKEEKPVNKLTELKGADRYQTAVEISKKNFEKKETLILASGENFPDALAAASLAGIKNAPLLLTEKGRVPEAVKDEIQRLGAKNIILVGGEKTIAATVEKTLEGKEVERLAGEDRYQTAAKITELVQKAHPEVKTVILADGRNYPDALAIGSYAARNGIGILLADGSTLSKETAEAVKTMEKVIIAGGEASVAEKIEKEIKAMGKETQRLAGADRYQTAVKVAENLYKDATKVVIASGEVYADALAVAAAKEKAPILLVKNNEIPTEVKRLLEGYKLEKITVLGGEKTIGQKVREELNKLVK